MISKAKGAFVVAVAVLTIGIVQPIESAEGLSLEQAISVALGENISVAAAETEVSVAEQAIRIARAQSYPSLAAIASYGTYSGDVMFTRFIPGAPGGSAGMDVGQYDSNRLVMLEIAQPLYTGGANKAQRNLRRVETAIAKESLRENRLNTVYDVTGAYYGLLLARKQVEVVAESLRRSEAGFALIDSRFKEQEALEAELLGAKSQLAADRLGLQHAQNEAQLALGKLNLLLGRDLNAPMEASGSLISAPPTPPRPDQASQVIRNTPAVRRADLQQQMGEALLARSRAIGRPKLELRGSYAWVSNDLLFKGDYAAATLNLSIPFVHDFTAGAAAKTQASAQQELALRSAQHAEREVQLAIEHAFRQLEEAKSAIEVAKSNLAYNKEKYRVQESAFKEELVTFSDLLDEHVDLAEAELAYFETLYNARLAEAHARRVVAASE